MLELLAEAEPQLEFIMTTNAAANDHMIAVNEQLGYEVAGPGRGTTTPRSRRSSASR